MSIKVLNKDIQRYRFDGVDLFKHPEGHWVKYEDYCARRALETDVEEGARLGRERDEARAQADGLRDALQAMFDEYEGVYDMAVPTKHQSEGAKRAEALARAALAALPKEQA